MKIEIIMKIKTLFLLSYRKNNIIRKVLEIFLLEILLLEILLVTILEKIMNKKIGKLAFKYLLWIVTVTQHHPHSIPFCKYGL